MNCKSGGAGDSAFAGQACLVIQRDTHQTMRIGQLAKSVGVNVETVRYYQRIGLLALPDKPYGGVRVYDDNDLRRLRFIRGSQRLGFSLEDIRVLLQLSRADCQEVQKLAEEKLHLVKAKLRQLRTIESALAQTVAQCAKRETRNRCPIIENLISESDAL